MGSFLGHVVPGTFFFAFAMWWMYNVFYRYFYAKRFRPTSYKNTSHFQSSCQTRLPLESLLKIVSVIIGILGEFITGFDDGKWTHWGNAQHITMFFFFGVNGVIDLCLAKKWDLPPKLDYVSASLAFAIEGFLFYHHLHDRAHMDIMVHMFLFYVIIGCVVSTTLEMIHLHNVMPALCRVFFTLLQGTWFYQVGFILYPPIGEKWDVENHTQMMIVTLIFTWHIAAVLATMAGIGCLLWLRVQNLPGPSTMYQMVDTADCTEKNCHQGRLSNGHLSGNKSLHQIVDSSDSEGEEA